MAKKLPLSFYRQDDVTSIARQLLGKVLVTSIDGERTAGIIVETEAYAGIRDRASHAWNNRRTQRTEVMYQPGGLAYVYLCYGLHYLFNVVTNVKEVPEAVLVRALEPLDGIAAMQQRYPHKNTVKMTAGPGSLCKALGIDATLNSEKLTGGNIWIEDAPPLPDNQILTGTRVGVQYAGADALLPYRFSIKDNTWVSKGKGL
ncbi:DNA-3-methyladenine glycosylase [Chitinophaga polysaccharea]|uniref:Putative 3-methyladenine DNA glycosylase n=1 Tax=Chitinophaga polysaccharea TaxID=1293035 RepID=A0A561PQU3_9BACT|nr:DNA-3-methyladenine glycosylase [Chitinophaga polysaccharea]TWF40487.1 DNA-3-methyladenine glycosylase [Chitinophaga polysaccharea]